MSAALKLKKEIPESCEGHEEAERWFIIFYVDQNKRGWAALDIVAYAIFDYYLTNFSDARIYLRAEDVVQPKAALGGGFIHFQIEGSDKNDLKFLPEYVRGATRAYYE